ncbi:MAG: hypothetical protein V1897_07765 [Pseudomonadota bacterium]
MSRAFLLAFFACIPLVCFFSEAEPSYLGRGSSGEMKVQHSVTGSFYSGIMEKITMIQKNFREWMSEYAREVSEAKSFRAAGRFLIFCFGYGVVHAAGPGHGKILISTYFIGKGGTIKQALFLGNLFSFTHVGSAVALVGGVAILFNSFSMSSISSVSDKLLPLSYFLVFLVGVSLLVQTALNMRRGEPQVCSIPTVRKPDKATIAALAIGAGIIPCPGATLILLFTVNLGIPGLGLAGMVALALGMGLTTSMVACLTLGFRGSVLSLAERLSATIRPLQTAFSIVGAFVITTFGLLLFVGSI